MLEKMESWLQTMIASDIEICVVSNSKRDRVKIFCEKYGIFCITHAKKPSAKGVLEAVAKYGIPKSQCALAGDQIFTDCLACHRAGLRFYLVPPIKDKNNRITRLKRHFEKGVLRRYYKRNPDAPDIRLGSPLTKEHVPTPKGEEQA